MSPALFTLTPPYRTSRKAEPSNIGGMSQILKGDEEAASQKGGWGGFREFNVEQKVVESDVITSFYLKPADKCEIADFQLGQYISIKFEIQGEKFTHISQCRLSDIPGKGYSVKREAGTQNPEGKVSNYLHDFIKEGDVLKVSAPGGDFILNVDKKTPVVLLSGGVGLTPMLSMLKRLLRYSLTESYILSCRSK